MKLEELFEGILDDISSDYSVDKTSIKFSPNVIDNTTSTRRKIFKGKKLNKFKEYYRSINELNNLLEGQPITVNNIIQLYANKYQAPADNIEFELKTSELYDIREYDRTRETGNLYTKEWDELKTNIKHYGIKDHGTIDMKRLPNGDVQVWIGEGNHRLAIANELDIKTMPMRFYIY